MRTPTADVFAYIAEEAPSWFPDLGDAPVDVTSTAHRDRRGVRLDHVTITSGQRTRSVVVKQYHGEGWSVPSGRPRLAPADDRSWKPACEYAVLRALSESDSLPAGARPVRPLAHVPDWGLLVMELFPGPSARELLGARRADIAAFVTGGRSLTAVHDLPTPDDPRRATGDDVRRCFEAFVRHLGSRRGSRYDHLVGWWRDGDDDLDVELGAGHGDCSPRNLLVDDAGRVAWIDGLCRYRVPIYEDLATFTTTVRVSARLSSARGLASARHRRRFADAFIDGYSSVRPVDRRVLRRFEALVLLDRQAALLAAGRGDLRARVLLSMTDRELASLTGRR